MNRMSGSSDASECLSSNATGETKQMCEANPPGEKGWLPDMKTDGYVSGKGGKMEADDLVVERSEPSIGVDVRSAGIAEQTQAREEGLGNTLREVMLAERPSTRGGQRISTDLSTKKIARKLFALLPKRKLSPAKLQTNCPAPTDGFNTRNTEHSDDRNVPCDQSEATLGDLLMRAGASFGSQYVPCRRGNRNSLVQILRLSGRVFCGSAGAAEDDCPTMAPLTISEEENDLAVHLIPDIMSMRQGLISGGFLVENFAADERGESVDSGNQTTAGNTNGMPHVPAQPVIDEQCTPNSTQLPSQQAMADGWWPNREFTNNPAHSPSGPLQGGNNTRLNTMLEGSPTLAHNERRVSDGHTAGAVEGRLSEAFLVNRVEETLQPDDAETAVAVVGTPIRVSLMTLLQERDDMIKPIYPMANEECDKNWQEQAEGLDPMCCVCMVGPKGAAFVPCGHTYCRSCTRELWRARGACPLCNKSIIQILDIY